MKYIEDIEQYVEAIPFGEATLKISRKARKTTHITTVAEETLKYYDNKPLKVDIESIIDSLEETKFTGDTILKLSFKDGKIHLLTIKSEKEVIYGQ